MTLVFIVLGGFAIGSANAADQPQWGQKHTRNMISGETNLVSDFDPATQKNVKWAASLGSETWSTPIVANGKVFIGTNNNAPRDPRHKGDRGILMCFNEKDGAFLWQLVVPKLGPDPYLDWPRAGIPSPATVEGDRVYIISNRNEVICLDINGQSNGNDGPYQDEARHMEWSEETAYAFTSVDADIIWIFDIPGQAGTYPHDSAHSSILLDEDFLYINTSNGVDNTHQKIRKPDAPSLIVLDKHSGRLLARDDENIGPRIFHSTWSSPALGVVNGQKLIFFAGGDGVIYAFAALESTPAVGEVSKLKRIWRFDCDPAAPKENVHEYLRNRKEGPSNIKGMPVFHDNRIYVAVGGDIWWGKEQAWLKCIDATKTEDVTTSALIWSYELKLHCCSTPAISDGLVFITDCGGLVHCVDAKTGTAYWTHDTGGEIWASPLVADGKVYVVNKRRDFFVFAANREKQVINTIRMDSPMAGAPTAANGVLYVPTMKNLYALQLDTQNSVH
ncbi:MAG: pyrrolo-quinoline quinone [Candidatus Omnitrophota bacterium]|nr:MAG: pyrrolo-quinoline quinone [Candidatus Omnitrophota bacterium]